VDHEIDIFYVRVPNDNADEALSFTNYCNQHGMLAVQENDYVTIPIDCPNKIILVYTLRETWRLYWEHFDSGLFGLPVITKAGCNGNCGES
jgi:hypothetical protein